LQTPHEAQATSAEVWPWLIHQATQAVTEKMAVGWIQHCGYFFKGDIDMYIFNKH